MKANQISSKPRDKDQILQSSSGAEAISSGTHVNNLKQMKAKGSMVQSPNYPDINGSVPHIGNQS